MNYEDPIINDPESIPPVLYKYRDWENNKHKRILTDLEIYFSSFDQFNDPFDGTIPLRYRKEDLTQENIFKKLRSIVRREHPDWSEEQIQKKCYESQRNNYIGSEEHIESINEMYNKKMVDGLGIFCLTNNCNNHLMWSHYSNSHKGCCVGFNTNELKNIIGTEYGVFSLHYETELPYFELFEEHMKFMKKLVCSKSKVWEYEQEYRIIRFDFARKILKITPETISQVIFGLMMNHKTKMEILELLKNNFPDTKVFESKRNTNLFEIDIERIY